ncbi:hypothetical protein JG559_05540 [Enterococcus faecalis]|uniref:Uncharacterized protein n=1 Tax=Enterococcus faecalis TaxID=1351 RepID=A0A974NZQ4_ENTFL|nr:hypothetical protein JG559_05540 [Enterococcus faecalis]
MFNKKTILCKSSFRGVRFRETTTSPFFEWGFLLGRKIGNAVTRNAVKRKNPREFISIKRPYLSRN